MLKKHGPWPVIVSGVFLLCNYGVDIELIG